MTIKLYNLAKMTTATTGTGTITLGSAVSGFLSFANAGVQNGELVFYGIRDGSNSEVGYGTYTSSGTTLTRNVIKSTNSDSAISLSGSAIVFITALAQSIGKIWIATVTPTGATATFSSIPGFYKKLYIDFAMRSTQTANVVDGYCKINSDTTAANYFGQEGWSYKTIVGANQFNTNRQWTSAICAASAPSNEFSVGRIEIPYYNVSSFNKHLLFSLSHRRDVSTWNLIEYYGALNWLSTSTITDIEFSLSAGNFTSGSIIDLYGEM